MMASVERGREPHHCEVILAAPCSLHALERATVQGKEGYQRSVARSHFNQSKSFGLSEIRHRNNKICVAAGRVRSDVEQTPKRQCSPQLNSLERFVIADSKSRGGTPMLGLNWFDDRAWPTDAPYPRSRRSEPQRSHKTLRLFFWLS